MSTYTTVQGDMWDAIAYKKLGSTDYTDALMNANPESIGYISIHAGVTLTLPEIEEQSVSSLPPWKQASG
ncbi:MAG: tail protein X [Oscillospiraceae bacterium]|nr:tail protein X [Oscillospiraceae bacterium]